MGRAVVAKLRADGAVLAAGIGPTPGRDRARLVGEVNHRGVVDLLCAWRPALAAAGNAKVVAFASNSATTVPLVPRRAVDALLADDADRAARALRIFGRRAPSLAYAASKIALSRWIRRTAVTEEWAGAGIRLNALAPGAILTLLLAKQLATPAEAKAIRSFPIPIGHFGDPDHLADWVMLMLSDSADFLCGSVVVDGGSDAWFPGRRLAPPRAGATAAPLPGPDEGVRPVRAPARGALSPRYRAAASSVPCLTARLASSSAATSAPPIRWTVPRPSATSSSYRSRTDSCPAQTTT